MRPRAAHPLLCALLVVGGLPSCRPAEPPARNTDRRTSPTGPTPAHTKSPRADPTPNLPPPAQRTDYLIVAGDALAASAHRYRRFRAASGHRVELRLTGSLAPKATPPGDRAQALALGIRAWIRDRWYVRDPARPFYVLLLGDGNHPVPTMTYTDPVNLIPQSTDNFYADMDEDRIPDLALGRIPARTDTEVDRVRAKVARYEQTYRVGLWNRRINLFAAPGDYGHLVDGMIEGLAQELMESFRYDYDIHVTYGRPGSPAAYPPERFSDRVYELLNEGSLFTVYIGHGTPKGPQTGWWNKRSFHVWKVDQLGRKLRVRNKPPILLLVACQMGAFADQDALGERVLFHEQGPPAVVAATGASHPYPNSILVRELGHLATNHLVDTVGLLLQRAKERMIKQRDEVRTYIDTVAALAMTKLERDLRKRTHLYMYVLLGDPAMRIRYVNGRARITLPTPALKPGKPLHLQATFEGLLTGTARFTLETRRKVIRGALLPVPGDRSPQRNRVLLANYRVANDKVVTFRAVRFRSGRASVTLRTPRRLAPGTYYVKVYADNGKRDAMGSVAVTVVAPSPAR